MQRRTILGSSVAVLAAMAGCSETSSDSDDGAADTTSNGSDENGEDEEEQEQEEELTLETFAYPERVDQDGFSRGLASVHKDRLDEAGSFEVTRTVEYAGRHSREEATTVAVDGDNLHFTEDDGFVTTNAWTDSVNGNSDVLVRNSNDIEERYLRMDQSRTLEDIDGSEALNKLFDAALYEASELEERDEGPVVVFDVVDRLDTDALRDVNHMDRYDDVDVSIAVSESGIVGYEYEFEGERYDRSAKITGSVAIDDVGETTLDEPDWVDEGRDRALELSIEPAADDSAFALTIDRGEAIPTGAEINIYARNEFRGELDQEVAPGDTLYLYDDGGQLGMSVNSEPTVDSSIDTEFAHVYIRTETGLVVYEGQYDSYGDQ